MKLFIKFDFIKLGNSILSEKLDALNINYKVLNFGEVEIIDKLTTVQYKMLVEDFQTYGLDIVENKKTITVQKIKDVIIEMVFHDTSEVNVKSSVYISEKLNQSYAYLSSLFSEVTHTSIENFIIIQKIEYAKLLLNTSDLNLTEIAFKLNYSSVAHLSKQFKNTTGITPSAFKRIVDKRKKLAFKRK